MSRLLKHKWRGALGKKKPPPPSAPRSLAGVDGGLMDASLTWLAPLTGPVTGYKVYRGLFSGTETLLTTIGNVLAYDDVAGGGTFWYKVSAYNAGGEGPQSNEISVLVLGG